MNYVPNMYSHQHPYFANTPMYHYERQPGYWTPEEAGHVSSQAAIPSFRSHDRIALRDYGPNPFTVNINEASKQNNNYRTALWTGPHLQVTLMSLKPGEDIGLEMHPNVDQFLRIEQGQGMVQMGKSRNRLNYVRNVRDDFAIMVPAGTWHNVTNTGNIPLKLYSIYAPPNHPFGTVHVTKASAMAAERSSGNTVDHVTNQWSGMWNY
jgi:mannose-6-phosphate isomerase-like protein (cupin superfamily)